MTDHAEAQAQIAAVLAGESEGCVIHGDCLEILPLIPAGSVDAVVTDPPYGMAYQSAWRTDPEMRFAPIAGDEQPFVWFLPASVAAMTDPAVMVCFCRWDTAKAFYDAMGWAGLSMAGQCVWDREHHGMGDLQSSPAPQFDTIWIGRKGKWCYPGRRGKSVLRHARLGGDQLRHPNEKPISLMLELVGDYAKATGIILDPFCGSGTTLVAAKRLGRRFIGIELDERYCQIARNRLASTERPLFQEVSNGR